MLYMMSMQTRTNPETLLRKAIVQTLRLKFSRVLTLWEQNTGAQVIDEPGKGRRFIRYGLCKGSSDIIGILAPSGKLVALEVKLPREAGGKSPTELQTAFLAAVEKSGGVAAVVRSVNDACQAIAQAIVAGNTAPPLRERVGELDFDSREAAAWNSGRSR